MPAVRPELLVWARKTAGLTIEDAAEKVGIGDTKTATATERLSAMESGRREPSRTVLLAMERVYHRPLVAFYLSRPPAEGKRGVDFRTLRGGGEPADEALLDALVRDILARQDMVRALLEDDEDSETCEFVGSRTVEDGLDSVLESLQAVLRTDLQAYRKRPTASKAFALLRDRVEATGVFVLLKGDLGSHRSRIPLKSFRGFAIADPIAPFLVINDHDAAPARSFALLHEVVHLLLGQTGVGAERTEHPDERFCDEVAGEFLLPSRELSELTVPRGNRSSAAKAIADFADERNLSRTMIAYRLARQGSLDWALYEGLSAGWRTEWLERKRRVAEDSKAKPNFYTVRRHRLGGRLTEVVRVMMDSEDLSTGRAARILGVGIGQVDPLLEPAGAQGGAFAAICRPFDARLTADEPPRCPAAGTRLHDDVPTIRESGAPG